MFIGDLRSFPIPQTNHQYAFVIHPPPLLPSPSLDSPRNVYMSNIKQGDSRINSFHFKQPVVVHGLAVEKMNPAGHPPVIPANMNQSHFPQGDLNKKRMEERMNFTTTLLTHRSVSLEKLLLKIFSS